MGICIIWGFNSLCEIGKPPKNPFRFSIHIHSLISRHYHNCWPWTDLLFKDKNKLKNFMDLKKKKKRFTMFNILKQGQSLLYKKYYNVHDLHYVISLDKESVFVFFKGRNTKICFLLVLIEDNSIRIKEEKNKIKFT